VQDFSVARELGVIKTKKEDGFTAGKKLGFFVVVVELLAVGYCSFLV